MEPLFSYHGTQATVWAHEAVTPSRSRLGQCLDGGFPLNPLYTALSSLIGGGGGGVRIEIKNGSLL